MDGHEALVHDVTIITEPSTKNSPAFSSKVCFGGLVGQLIFDLFENLVLCRNLVPRNARVANT